MKLKEEKCGGLCKTYEGAKGEAILTRNFGNRDKTDKWSVNVIVDGEYKKLATRAEFNKAYAMAEEAIG